MKQQVRDQHYPASDVLVIIIVNLVYKVKRDSYICDFILLVFTTILYNNYAKNLSVFIGGELTIMLLVAFVQYKLVFGKGKFVNAIATYIRLSNDDIVIKTAPFKGPVWFRKKPADIRMSKASTKLYQLTNPYPLIFRGSRQVLKLENNGIEVFILSDYFDPRLEEQLRND